MARARTPAGDDRARGGAPAVRQPPARLEAAVARHDELLARIERRRRVRDRLAEDTRAAVTTVGARMHALATLARELDAEIHALMQALCADARRPRWQRIELERIYAELEGEVIAPRAPRGVKAASGSARSGSRERPREPEPLAPSRARPALRGTLRALFRRLADALHPDKVQDDGERDRRTEVMKQITVAYQDGDYARLIEIERSWTATIVVGAEDAAPDELERRIAAKERAVAELEAQLAALEREIRALRSSDDGKLAREYQRAGGDDLPMEVEAAEELARLRAVRDFVAAFADGRLTFEEFRQGPERQRPPEDPFDARDPFDDPSVAADLRDGPPRDVARVIADLERLARAEGVRVEDLLRAVQAAAHGAGVGPRPRRRR